MNKKCPNCGSGQYFETVSLEKCSSCGLECDYHGKGPNKVYNQMLIRKPMSVHDEYWEPYYRDEE